MSKSVNEAKALIKLLEKDSLSISAFSKDKMLVKKLEELGVIRVFSNIGKRGKSVKKANSFNRYIETNYNNNLQRFIDIDNRGDLIEEFGEDKIKTINPQTGLYLWSDDSVDIGGGQIVSCREGVATFVHHATEIKIDREILIVGVENFETVIKAINIKSLFKGYKKKILFMFRNSSFLKFIKLSQNEILYFPDFDIYGVRIYETEILKYNRSVELFIPNSLAIDCKESGNRKRYFEDLNSKYGNYRATTSNGKLILEIIEESEKILSQEFYSINLLNSFL